MKGLRMVRSVLNPQTTGGKVFLSVLVLLLTFPAIDPSYSTGLDCSAWYSLNYFFHNGIQLGRDVLFTYGPLTFLEIPIPLGNNLPLSILFTCIVYITFSYSALSLGQLINKEKWLLHLGIVFIACELFFIENLLIGLTAISVLIHFESKKGKWILLSILSTMFALYIKASFGIACLFIILSYCALCWLLLKDRKTVIKIIGGLILAYFIFWFCIYSNFNGSLRYLWATFQFAKGYSAALSVYPTNNWWLLAFAIISFFLIPFRHKDKRIYFFYSLLFLSVFSAWKHGYSREEEAHLNTFYNFVILFFLLLFIYIDKIRIAHLLLITVVLTGFYRNMQLTGRYNVDDRISLNKFNNFCEVFFDYKNFVEKALSASAENIKPMKLPDTILKLVGNSTVDFYPYELGYVAANKLNWKPRPVIQTYLSYTEWLDKQNMKYFASGECPEYILWEFTSDRWGEKNFGEFDNRYVLNDEPMAVYELLNHYSAVYKDTNFILFKKSAAENLAAPKNIKTEALTWNKWIKVPSVEDGILRARMKCSENLTGFIKSQLYKGEEFFMDCKLMNGNVIRYRIFAEDAQQGLWINPLLLSDMGSSFVPSTLVDEVQFISSDTWVMQSKITITWESIEVRKQPGISMEANTGEIYIGKFKNAWGLFMKYKDPCEKMVFHSLNTFENKEEYWLYDDSIITGKESYNGKKSEQIDSQKSHYPVFTIPLNSFINDSTILTVGVSAWCNLSENASGVLIILLYDDNGTFFWKSKPLSNYCTDYNQWEQISAEEKISTTNRKNVHLRVFINNEKDRPIWVDDFDIKLYSYRLN
jgi:hypothetical protein